jgi:hypothetical protein
VYVDWSRFSQSVATPAHVCQVCQIPLHPLLYGPDQPLSQTRLLASQGGPESDHLPTVR